MYPILKSYSNYSIKTKDRTKKEKDTATRKRDITQERGDKSSQGNSEKKLQDRTWAQGVESDQYRLEQVKYL